MNLMEKQIKECEKIQVPSNRESDFDKFWENAVSKSKNSPLKAKSKILTDYPVKSVEVRDMTFEGLDGTPVKTWMLLPEGVETPVPAVIKYHGAGGDRSVASAYLQYTSMGMAVIAMDYRMQGGLTGSNSGFTLGGAFSWFSLGLNSSEKSYLYYSHTDALRAIELALQTDEIADSKICVFGGSQGGGTALAMASLHEDVNLCIADVPSNCWFEKRLFDRAGSVAGVADFLNRHPDKIKETLKSLSYFDNINLVDRIKCPVMISTGMKDPVCPPENVYAAYNKIKSEKEIHPYPFGEHGGGGAYHSELVMRYLYEKFIK